MNHAIEQLKQSVAPIRERLVHHPLYAAARSLEDLNVFMEHHVFAVWDFMSLLKTLQRRLTCVEVPWVPVGRGSTRFLVNEIVTGEESDVDQEGNRLSHFELYLQAMRQSGADTRAVEAMIGLLSRGVAPADAVRQAGGPAAAAGFVGNTFDTVACGDPHVQAAVFTFGREDLIPGMFMSFVAELDHRESGRVGLFRYYLERHIEVDGGHHSHLAQEMTAELCGTDAKKWSQATVAVRGALEARIRLWDAIAGAVEARTAAMPAVHAR